MMASRALITSSFDACFLLNVRRRLKAFVGGRKLNTNAFGRPGPDFGFSCSLRSCSRVIPWVAIFSTNASIFFGSPWRATCRRIDLLDLTGDSRERQRLGDRRPRLPQPFGEIFVRVAALVAEAVQRLGLFERRQVLALDVLDQRQLQHLGIVDVAHDHRQFDDTGPDGGLITPFAGDDLVAVTALAHDQWLDDPLFGEG
jgi:hypothetical protein